MPQIVNPTQRFLITSASSNSLTLSVTDNSSSFNLYVGLVGNLVNSGLTSFVSVIIKRVISQNVILVAPYVSNLSSSASFNNIDFSAFSGGTVDFQSQLVEAMNQGDSLISQSPYSKFPQLPVQLDAFGRFRTSAPSSVFDSKLLYDNAPSLWDDQSVSGSGTSSTYNTNQASVTLEVSNLTAGKRVRQTFKRFMYQPGKGQLFNFTSVLGTSKTGITARVGAFDDNNGVFFENSPTVINLGIRSSVSGSVVDFKIPQSSWNIDKMDGSGPSGVKIDFTKTQIFAIDFQWLGVGSVRFGFLVNGVVCPAHIEHHANLFSTVYMSNPNSPLRYEISNDGTGVASSLLQICSAVISEGGQEFTGLQRSITRGATALQTLNNSNLYPLLAMRIQSGKLSATVRPVGLSALSTTNSNLDVQLLLNPTVTGGAFSFSAVPNSVVEVDVGSTNALTVTNGTLLASTVCAIQASVNLVNTIEFQLGVTIAGVSDIVVLAARRLTGTAENIFGTLSWRETY